jgi:hypothetical protein
MAVRRLGISNPQPNTDTSVYTANAFYLASVIITNKSATQQTARVWVVPSGSTSPNQHGYILYETPVPAGNAIESHRFALNTGDAIWVRGSSLDMSFSANGIYDSSASIDEHIILTTNVHGIADTSELVTADITDDLNARLVSIELGLGIFD